MAAIQEGLLPDIITIIKMREGENQFRSLTPDEHALGQLPQGYDLKNGYPGDRAICKEKLSIQVHYVYTDRNEPNKIIPVLAVNNPCDTLKINYVTGDNEYDT